MSPPADPDPATAHILELAYLYVGSADTGRDVEFYREALGAELVWRFQAFEADVAAVRVGSGPLVLLADHRPPGTVLPLWSVDDLDATIADMKASGWDVDGPVVEVPDGPCLVVRDPSGVELGFLHRVRPGAMTASYAEPGNSSAVR